MRGEEKIRRERGRRRKGEIGDEREKFECRFEEIKKRNVMTEIGKRVIKMFLIFERELYTFVMLRIMWGVRRGEVEVARIVRLIVIIIT